MTDAGTYVPGLYARIFIHTKYVNHKKAQLSLTNPRDACEMFARFT